MATPSQESHDSARVRQRAEQVLASRTAAAPLTEAETQHLLHELQVHQVELEMQNAELLDTREQLATLLKEFTDLYELAPVGYLSLDPGGSIRRANLKAAALLHLARSSLQGRSLSQLLDTGSRRRFLAFLAAHFLSRGPGSCEVALPPGRLGDPQIWLRLEATIPASAQESRVALIDITEAREAHALLINHQERLEQLVAERTRALEARNAEYAYLYNRSPAGHHSLDAQGNFIEINDTLLKMLNLTREEVLGRMSIRDLLDEPSLQRFNVEFPAFQRTGSIRNSEITFKRADGSLLPVLISADVKRDAAGKFLCSLTTVVDNTLRKEAERKQKAARLELERREAEYAELYNHAPCGYHSLDSAGNILAINDTMLGMLGYARAEVLGHLNIRDLLDDRSRETFAVRFPAFLQSGSVQDIETFFRRKDGSVFPALVSAVAKRDAHGVFLSTLSTVVDNTLRREVELRQQATHEDLERQVVERTRLVRRLAVEATMAEERERRAIAHDLHDDLGQLLHITSHQLDLLAAAETPAQRQELITRTKATLAKASRSVRSLTSQLSPPVLETLGLVSALLWLAEEMDQTYGLKVEIQDDGQPKPLSPSLSTFLFRAARELLVNVAKHSGSATAIVRARVEGQWLFLEVEDKGVGIQDLEQVLRRTKGFGLRNIRERVLQLGGQVTARRNPGDGWTLSLGMPLEPDSAKEQA